MQTLKCLNKAISTLIRLWLSEDNYSIHLVDINPSCFTHCRAIKPHNLQANEQLLSAEYLQSWMKNFTIVVHHAKKALLPHEPVFVYHTIPIPRITDQDSIVIQSNLFGIVHQLNVAGRISAHHLHMHVLDMEMMANGLPQNLGMQDQHHPSRMVLQVSYS